MHTVLRSATKQVAIGPDQPFCIIGERINPTGRPKFQAELRAGDLHRVEEDVRVQLAGGAMMLDVNMGVPLADEAELLVAAIQLIQSITDLPLCIDSSVVEALDAGLAAYQGKALVNSVTGETERLEQILPLVKRHGAAVIALPNEEEQIPEDPAERLRIARKIVHIATTEYGIPIEDIVIDPLAMPVGANHEYGRWTCDAITLIRDELGVNQTLGASNVSFGMPGRHALASAFLPMAIRSGLTSAIMDARTPMIIETVKASDLMMGNDAWGASWIADFRAKQKAAQQAAEAAEAAQAAEPAEAAGAQQAQAPA
jgi:5-methyltetrahydrofolate--homocysteine methyltransferase